MPSPLLLEINTRCWLRELSDAAKREISLASTPEQELDRWQRLGFTHIWLMGVWKTGPRSRAAALAQPHLRQLCAEAFGSWNESDLDSSPYAIAEYAVSLAFGGEEGLRRFRERLHQRGLRLIVDFVPNHLGLDHRLLSIKPGLFVSSQAQRAGTFLEITSRGPQWIAHGKDPFFTAWTDTAQLDYRQPETREAMVDILKGIAARCDGVRCDMAMLLLNEVFAKTWRGFPTRPVPQGEFWAEAIRAIRQSEPGFLFLAESYWNSETRLQELGFDYTYDKTFYDLIVRQDLEALQRHIQTCGNNSRMARFLENHDEPRVASLLSFAQHKAAAELLLRQPGLRLVYDGQLSGRRRYTPVQLSRYLPEPLDREIERLYEDLLASATGRFSECGR